MIINSSYFVGDIFLPQVGPDASTVANNEELLSSFINEYEPKILKKALGTGLYKELKGQLQPNGTLIENAAQKWDDLLNGAEYDKGGITHYWRGIVDSSNIYKKSFIAYYIYYWYIKNGVDQTTTLGIVKAEAENANGASAVPKLTHAWREFHEWYSGRQDSHIGNMYVDRGVVVRDYFSGVDNSKDVSLFTFLTDHKDVYDNWYFTHIENKTSMGI